MKTYEFTLVLANCAELTEAMAEAIAAAGCQDASPRSSQGIVSIDFDRDAESLESAIRCAIAQAQSAGLTVARVEIEPDAAVLRG